MKAISQFVIHVVDLLEAEGSALRAAVRVEARRAQTSVTNMAAGAAFLLVSVPLLVGGFWLVAAGLMWWLETQVSRPLAACLTGLAVLAVGGGCLIGFKVLAGRRLP